MQVEQHNGFRGWEGLAASGRGPARGKSDASNNGILSMVKLQDSRVVCGNRDGKLTVWDMESGKCTTILIGHRSSIWDLDILNDGRVLSGSSDTFIKIWDVDTGECSATMCHGSSVSCCAVVGAQRVVSGGDDNVLILWDVDNCECLSTLKGHAGHAMK